MTFLATCATQQIPQGTPKRLTVLPHTDVIRGKDGRAWKLGDTTQLLTTLNAQGPVLVDIDHGSVKGTNGQAAGWLSNFTLTPEGIEAAVEWTPIGEALLAKRAYRYLSPTLHYDTTGATTDILGTVRTLHSVGLVNTPNLQGLSALNNESDFQVEQSLDATDRKLMSQLGLTEAQYRGASGERVSTNAAAARSGGLDAADLKICRLMGVRPEDYLASGPRR